MGLFGQTPQSELDVEKATDGNNIKDEWGLILEVCDKAAKSTEAKDYLKAILKRINHHDPHVAIQAVTVLDACVKNCGINFHIEVASREFETEYCKILKKAHPKVSKQLRESLKRWAEGEFKTNPQLNLIPTLYSKLRNNGIDFNLSEDLPKRDTMLSKDPNVVQSQEEEDQIAKAIELSLKETSGSPRSHSTTAPSTAGATASAAVATATVAASSSLYPSTNMNNVKEQRKVRALYDFEAVEDNELTFSSGEIIFIIDDSDPNWWKGTNQRGEGLFPANFVTSDLSLDPDQLIHEKKKKLDQLDESLEKKFEEIKEPDHIEIDEGKIDRLLHLLHEADPTNPEYDTKEMLSSEKEVNSMGGLIDKELEKVDRKHAQLTQLSSDLVEALNLYHSLMREPQFSSLTMKGQFPYQQPNSMMFNGTLPHPSSNLGAPASMLPGYNTLPHDRFMQQQLPPGTNMPPGPGQPGPFTSLPPHMQSHIPPPGSSGPSTSIPQQVQQHQPMSAPPQSLPPHNLPPMPHEDPRMQQPAHFPPPTGFNSGNFPPPPHLHQQNGIPLSQSGSYSMPPASNTHIM